MKTAKYEELLETVKKAATALVQERLSLAKGTLESISQSAHQQAMSAAESLWNEIEGEIIAPSAAPANEFGGDTLKEIEQKTQQLMRNSEGLFDGAPGQPLGARAMSLQTQEIAEQLSPMWGHISESEEFQMEVEDHLILALSTNQRELRPLHEEATTGRCWISLGKPSNPD